LLVNLDFIFIRIDFFDKDLFSMVMKYLFRVKILIWLLQGIC